MAKAKKTSINNVVEKEIRKNTDASNLEKQIGQVAKTFPKTENPCTEDPVIVLSDVMTDIGNIIEHLNNELDLLLEAISPILFTVPEKIEHDGVRGIYGSCMTLEAREYYERLDLLVNRIHNIKKEVGL